MTTINMDVAARNDADLVRATLAGDREAFEQIVHRYQALVCSLTYSGTGNLSQSEDLAQETFVTAWNQLAGLREPEKLRAWLCGIARNLANNTRRKQNREPSHVGEPLENISLSPSLEPLPVESTISKEEEAILWRSLEKVPETYREPLILFYREHQSVEAVAEKLGLTTETVYQRLSRGRKLLADEVTTFVEGALVKSNPGRTFSLGVLAALPISLAASAKAATVTAVAKGGTTATGTSLLATLLGILSGPALGFLFGFLGWRESLKNTRTLRERALVKRYGITILVAGIVFFVVCTLLAGFLPNLLWKNHPVLLLALMWAVCLSWVVFVMAFSWRHNRAMSQLRVQEQDSHPGALTAHPVPEAGEYRSRATLLGLPLVHWRGFARTRTPGEKAQPTIGWIACGERAYGILYASGGIAVGGIATGGLSIGLISFGGLSLGLLAFGGFALGAIALGGGAIGYIASGGMALGWHAALGGMVAAHDIAYAGIALANHVNDSVAKDFFQNHRWLDFTQAGPRNTFWLLCFGPILAQTLLTIWWRRKLHGRTKQS